MINISLLSITVCIYNGKKYFQERLDSFLNQTYSTAEIVIMDDRSTDQTKYWYE